MRILTSLWLQAQRNRLTLGQGAPSPLSRRASPTCGKISSLLLEFKELSSGTSCATTCKTSPSSLPTLWERADTTRVSCPDSATAGSTSPLSLPACCERGVAKLAP